MQSTSFASAATETGYSFAAHSNHRSLGDGDLAQSKNTEAFNSVDKRNTNAGRSACEAVAFEASDESRVGFPVQARLHFGLDSAEPAVANAAEKAQPRG